MKKLTPPLIVLASFGLLLLLAGCGSKEVKPPPTNINVVLQATGTVNPDGTGRASPVIVRLYALKSLGKFNAADFYSLYNGDQAQLGADLVSVEEIQLKPGAQRIYAREVQQDALYLGVIAAYRNLDTAVWRDSIPLPGGRTTNFSVKLDANTVSIRAE